MGSLRNFDLNIPMNEDWSLGDNNSAQNSGENITNHIDLNHTPDSQLSLGEENHISDVEILFDNPENIMNHIDLNQPPPYDGEEDDQSRPPEPKKLKMLSNHQRHLIYCGLLEKSNNGKLKKITTRSVATMFSVSMSTVQRIWNRAKESSSTGEVNVSHRRTRNCGRKRIQINPEQLRNIPLSQRTSLESTACALNISKSSLFRQKKSGNVRRHTSAIRPFLKEENKKSRMRFCLSMIEMDNPNEPKFKDMYDTVFIDEKWFNGTEKSQRYYLHPDEEEPHRTCKSKGFISKIMFLTAMARPRFDEQGNEVFSGKIGIFPFITKEPAKRRSVNRPAGTLETKAMSSIGRDVVRSFLIEKVLPAIREKWPVEDRHKPIFIQQDNARTHIGPNDEEFRQAATQEGFDIRLKCQPPNSPDFNVLDLGFFRAIQSLQHKTATNNLDELIAAVEKSFDDFSIIKSNRIFLSLQLCMRESMKIRGSINYKIPHIDKQALEREKRLPRQINCDPKLVEDVIGWLN